MRFWDNRIVKRIIEGLAFLWLLSLISFLVVKMAPGDVTMSLLAVDDMVVTEEQLATARQALGLNSPWFIQYCRYLNGLLHFDLGRSVMTGQPVIDEIMRAFPATLALTVSAFLIMFIFIGLLGSFSAYYQNSWFDRLTTAFCLFGASIPSFWLGLLLINLFSVWLKWLPSSGLADWRGLLLPALVLAIAMSPPYVKLFRNSLIETNRADFIRAARARGVPELQIFWRDILRASLIPLVTVLGVSLSSLLGGTVIVEVIFGLPGLGKMAVEALFRRDYIVIQGFIIFMGILTFAINLLVDLSYRYLDPTIPLKESERR